MRYFDPIRNWNRIAVHLPAAEPVLVRDFNRYTWGRWRQKFLPGKVPHTFESCDWWCEHRGPIPRYWNYVKHAACHWLVNHNLALARGVMPKRAWHILTSEKHSTVYDGHDLLFDLNFCALGVPPEDAYRAALDDGRGEILKPGEQLKVYLAEHWTRLGGGVRERAITGNREETVSAEEYKQAWQQRHRDRINEIRAQGKPRLDPRERRAAASVRKRKVQERAAKEQL